MPAKRRTAKVTSSGVKKSNGKLPTSSNKPNGGREKSSLRTDRKRVACRNKTGTKDSVLAATAFENIGRSSSSNAVPFAFIRGQLSRTQLAELQAICAEQFHQMQPCGEGILREGIGKRKGLAFRASEKVPQMRCNGAEFKRLAPQGLQRFARYLTKKNASLCAAVRKVRGLTHTHGKEKVPVIPKSLTVEEALFSLVGIAQWTDGQAHDPWHVDGGPSTVFFNATVRGERILEVEDFHGRSKKIHMRPGDFYVSSPSCFWHRVLPVHGATEPAESLILRSAMLPKRLSGGRAKANGRRSAGFVYDTKNVFEKVAAAVTKELTTNGFNV
eukprot:TRINITY_DN52069_c0_g1_i1.p1 TRINITY_DN52069_c0_g1~~TRINITY_DN52069_c0_g1_i1.p1  ORF type:complete len:329 (-),score=35.17 TRINITY_DN52069_c0_g1_i1:310-1296(-)